tara:strand:+ start:195 stop:713 length:519 start_codon:yes stop_codon:yes gene_type:complete
MLALLFASPSLVADGSTLATAKRTLLTAVSRREGTQAILRAVADVEALGAVTETVEGRWSLIYSTNQAGPIDTAAPGLSQAVIDKTYATLFKNVPALAGAQTDNKAAVSNIQTLDLTSGLLTNRVRPAMPSSVQCRSNRSTTALPLRSSGARATAARDADPDGQRRGERDRR